MRVRIIGGLAAAALVVACGGEAATGTPAVSPTPSPSPTMTAVTLERSPDSGQVDRVGADDGALYPDGVKDLSFVAQIDGPIAAVFLVSVDDQGKPTGQYQADTLVGDAIGPAELGAKPGSGTSGLGVAEGERMLNAKDGSLPPLGAGPHRLTLYVAESATLKSAKKLRVYVQRPDKSLAAAGTLAN
ncbi:MAG TPA: hypothetical protein VLT33_06850 [Labilithrix sp.]|nr:hypothetical protein [Labilithrix sp.]